MAQADADVAFRLRVAISNIHNFPRGIRHRYDYPRTFNVLNETVFTKLLKEYTFLTINNYFDNEPPFQLQDVVLSGSVSEGALELNLKEKRFSKVDFMLVLKNIQVNEADQEKGNLTVKENTPFVNFYLTDQDLLKTWSKFLEFSIEPKCKRAKLSSRKLKERFRENYTTNSPFAAPLNDEDVELVDDGPCTAIFSGATSNEESKDAKTFLKNFPETDFNFVLAIKCNGWPLCAKEWISRQRCWPSQDLVKTIIRDGFHIVCKSSPEGDFRLSYSNAETLLIGNLTDFQFKTYRAFKSFVSHHKKNWSDNAKKAVCSYHLKTIVLWYCEKSDPKDWTEDKIVAHLLSLIDDLILAMNGKNLPMYFMPKYNLMERLEHTTEALEQMAELRLNLNLITEAVISEEPSLQDRWKSVMDIVSDEAFQVIFSKSFCNEHQLIT